MTNRSEWKPVLKAIKASGWAQRPCKHGLYVYPSDSSVRPITLAGTPGDVRSIRNARAQLRRAGLVGI